MNILASLSQCLRRMMRDHYTKIRYSCQDSGKDPSSFIKTLISSNLCCTSSSLGPSDVSFTAIFCVFFGFRLGFVVRGLPTEPFGFGACFRREEGQRVRLTSSMSDNRKRFSLLKRAPKASSCSSGERAISVPLYFLS